MGWGRERRSACLAILLLLFGTLQAMEKPMEHPARFLPDTVRGWERTPGVDVYTPDTLFEYIDGGAELYLSFGFRTLWACRYTRANHPEITVDIFDMGHPHNAFGVHTHGREASNQDIGQGGEYLGGLLTFWKDRYYVSVLGYPETGTVRDLVLDLGRTIANHIEGTGALPPLISFLPREGLLPDSIRYFHHHVWINSHIFISQENVLNIGTHSAAVLARYTAGPKPVHLLVVSYPGGDETAAARRKYTRSRSLADADGVHRGQDGTWTGILVDENRLWVVLNASRKQDVETLLSRIGRRGN